MKLSGRSKKTRPERGDAAARRLAATAGYLDERPDLLRAVALANSYHGVQPAFESTGVRTGAARFAALGLATQARSAEQFLLASRFRRDDPTVTLSTQPYFRDDGLAVVALIGHETPTGAATPLPESTRLPISLDDAIRRRRSRREHGARPISLTELATLLRSAAGVTVEGRYRLADGEIETAFRAAPSGGGLYPVDLYVAASDVDGLDRGVYRYDSNRDVLTTVPGSDVETVLDACAAPNDRRHLERSAATVLMVGRPWRSMRKYGARGLRFVLIEAGAIAQNLHLAAEGLGLASVACGSFCDDEVHTGLAVDGLYHTFVHALIIGQPE